MKRLNFQDKLEDFIHEDKIGRNEAPCKSEEK